jgi:hypothetical protein
LDNNTDGAREVKVFERIDRDLKVYYQALLDEATTMQYTKEGGKYVRQEQATRQEVKQAQKEIEKRVLRSIREKLNETSGRQDQLKEVTPSLSKLTPKNNPYYPIYNAIMKHPESWYNKFRQ